MYCAQLSHQTITVWDSAGSTSAGTGRFCAPSKHSVVEPLTRVSRASSVRYLPSGTWLIGAKASDGQRRGVQHAQDVDLLAAQSVDGDVRPVRGDEFPGSSDASGPADAEKRRQPLGLAQQPVDYATGGGRNLARDTLGDVLRITLCKRRQSDVHG